VLLLDVPQATALVGLAPAQSKQREGRQQAPAAMLLGSAADGGAVATAAAQVAMKLSNV
jgi:hypothetical protein